MTESNSYCATKTTNVIKITTLNSRIETHWFNLVIVFWSSSLRVSATQTNHVKRWNESDFPQLAEQHNETSNAAPRSCQYRPLTAGATLSVSSGTTDALLQRALTLAAATLVSHVNRVPLAAPHEPVWAWRRNITPQLLPLIKSSILLSSGRSNTSGRIDHLSATK